MLYQTGYLTIKDYQGGRYLLGVPDEEISVQDRFSPTATEYVVGGNFMFLG